MSLKKLSDFIQDEIEPNKEGRRPDVRTVRKLPWAFKRGGTWWVDMGRYRADMRNMHNSSNRLNELLKDARVANLVGNG